VSSQHATSRRSEGVLLGRLAGVPVLLARSWLVVAVAVTWLFGRTVAQQDPGLGVVAAHAVALGYAVLLALSVLVHEVAHALSARAFGMSPTRIVLTLWGGHTQFDTDARTPLASFVVAAAGPASNAVLAAAVYFGLGPVTLPPWGQLLVLALALANAFVAVTNVLPGLPLDGGRMLEAVVWALRRDRDAATVVAAWAGRVVAVAIPVLVALSWVSGGSGPSVLTLAWAALVGALLWSGAGAELQAARVRRRAPGASVAALARPAAAVAATAPLARALAAADAGPVVLTGADGRPTGVLDPQAAREVPAERRGLVPASAAEVALADGAVLAWGLGGLELLAALPGLPREPWVVVDEAGAVRGVLLTRDVVAAVAGRRLAARR
jgi:Zn-dependent protease